MKMMWVMFRIEVYDDDGKQGKDNKDKLLGKFDV
jgi:hypothetical protein